MLNDLQIEIVITLLLIGVFATAVYQIAKGQKWV